MHGEELLRVKGLLRVAGEDAPIVVQAVQHVVYPPYRLPSFRDPLVGSRVVLITRSANPSLLPALRASLEGLAAPPRQDAHAPAAPPR
jgi:G3E family GTPase